MPSELTVVTDRHPGRPRFDTAVSRALLQRVAAGELPETLRLHVPDRVVAFGSRDAVHPAYAEAKRAAAAAGFGSYLRLAGGRAAVFHEETVAFGWAIPDPEPRAAIRARFDAVAAILRAALRSLGVDARVGEVPGEYCPGSHSINAGGAAKLAGVGQRLVDGATFVGGVVVAGRADLVNRALTPVYGVLGVAWDPAATGAVADHAPVTTASVLEAVREAFAEGRTIGDGAFDPETLALAERIAAAPLR
ncbi:MAG: lipoate--protein ligase family protein [Actinobacteria bacterium]|nr:lipoate--protein ligase family protein [Actinomycetota bacterium]